MKICTRCSTEKSPQDFTKNSKTKDGLGSWCRSCANNHRSSLEREIRLQALSMLGSKCVECGFSDTRALQIDHVNGGGKQEAKKLGGFQRIYRKIVSDGIDNYQLLCANCNWIKRATNNECPQRVF